MKRSVRALMSGAVLLGTLAASAAAQDRTVITGGRVLQPDGSLASGLAVIVAGGKVEKVVPADQAATGGGGGGAKDAVIRLDADAVVSPGLIDLFSVAGALNDTVERANPVDPALTAIDAFNPNDRMLRRALQSGVTTVMLTPAETNVIAGAASTVRTWSGSAARPDVLRADGPMVVTLGTMALQPDREPTSRVGAMKLLRDALAAAKSGKGDARLSKVTSKQMDVLAICEAPADVDAAARTFGEHGVSPNLYLGPEAIEVAADLGGTSSIVVLGPLTFDSPSKSLRGPAALAKEGVQVAFTSRTPLIESAGVRVTASLAVRYGMDPKAARLGFTRHAARVAGVADKVGSLEAGKDADIVIFSNDPLRLDARVQDVFVKGVRVYVRPQDDAAHDTRAAANGGHSHASNN